MVARRFKRTEQGFTVQHLATSNPVPASIDVHRPTAASKQGASAQENAGFSENHDFRVLLIDDNLDAIDSMGALLTLLDYDVRTAEDAESALDIATAFQPHLILSDIGLPGMDGYQLAPELRRVAGSRKLVLAAATGYGMASDKKKAREAGFDYHLVKPLDADMLIEFVARQMREY
jgi:CheY-like chemotaxis protein